MCKNPAGKKFTATDNIFFDDFNINNLQFIKELMEEAGRMHFQEMKAAVDDVLAVAKSKNGTLKAKKFNAFFASWEALTEDERSLILPSLKKRMDKAEAD